MPFLPARASEQGNVIGLVSAYQEEGGEELQKDLRVGVGLVSLKKRRKKRCFASSSKNIGGNI